MGNIHWNDNAFPDPDHRPHIRIAPIIIPAPIIPTAPPASSPPIPTALEFAGKHVDLWIDEERAQATIIAFNETVWEDEANSEVDHATGMMNLERIAKKVHQTWLNRVAHAFDQYAAKFVSPLVETINTLHATAKELKNTNHSMGASAAQVLGVLEGAEDDSRIDGAVWLDREEYQLATGILEEIIKADPREPEEPPIPDEDDYDDQTGITRWGRHEDDFG